MQSKEKSMVESLVLENEKKLKTWDSLVIKGMSHALSGISQMLGHQISIDSINITQVPIKNIPDVLGGPDAPAIGIYFSFSGAVNGHIMITHQPEFAYLVVDMIMGTTSRVSKNLNEKEQSILGEINYIMGHGFLDEISHTLGIPLNSSAPVVICDRAKAITDIALSEILQEHESITIVKTVLGIDQKTVPGLFAIMVAPNIIQLPLNLPGKV